MKKERTTVEKGFLYEIYFYEGLYFLELPGNKYDAGYETLSGAREAAYYAGRRDQKD